MSIFRINVQNTYKLFTSEDRYNVHKLLGITCLCHFLVRFAFLVCYRDMMFTWSMTDIVLLLYHFFLSISSLIFRIPNNRIKTMIVIWPEFRIHSILFATRSLICIAIFYLNQKMKLFRTIASLIVIATMALADKTSSYYTKLNHGRTTMRGMSWPNVFPFNQVQYQKIHNFFYSFSQIGASLAMVNGRYPDYPFMMLLPIQIAPFLSTLVKKGIISDFYWHLVYTITLLLPYIDGFFLNNSDPYIGIRTMFIFAFLRFGCRMNKYLLWTLITIMTIVST